MKSEYVLESRTQSRIESKIKSTHNHFRTNNMAVGMGIAMTFNIAMAIITSIGLAMAMV